jgi:hypothetical protein
VRASLPPALTPDTIGRVRRKAGSARESSKFARSQALDVHRPPVPQRLLIRELPPKNSKKSDIDGITPGARESERE